MKKVYLNITTWAGSFGIHYYGSLWCGGKREEVRWIPPEDYLKMLNSFESRMDRIKSKKKTIKFLREGDVIQEAIKQYKTIFPGAIILFQGNPMSIKGCPILDGKE